MRPPADYFPRNIISLHAWRALPHKCDFSKRLLGSLGKQIMKLIVFWCGSRDACLWLARRKNMCLWQGGPWAINSWHLTFTTSRFCLYRVENLINVFTVMEEFTQDKERGDEITSVCVWLAGLVSSLFPPHAQGWLACLTSLMRKPVPEGISSRTGRNVLQIQAFPWNIWNCLQRYTASACVWWDVCQFTEINTLWPKGSY